MVLLLVGVLAALVPSASLATPEPTPAAPRETPRPARTPVPSAGAVLPRVPAPVIVAPARKSLVVGYSEPGILGQLPFLVADLAGYFTEAGFSGVTLVEVPNAIRDVREGALDFAVVPSRAAWEALGSDPSIPAVAGYQNYDREDGSYGGSLVMARPGLVADEPATVVAFLSAYVRALQDLADPASAADALDLIEESALAVPPNLAAEWEAQVARYAPFDGGFGSVAEEDGYGELAGWLSEDPEAAQELRRRAHAERGPGLAGRAAQSGPRPRGRARASPRSASGCPWRTAPAAPSPWPRRRATSRTPASSR